MGEGTITAEWWYLIAGFVLVLLGLLQALVVGGVFGLFSKVLDTEHRLSLLEGICEERRNALSRMERQINNLPPGEER